MAYKGNPFLERMSERTTSDQDFVQQFAPQILGHIEDRVLDGGVSIFRSAPGGGKTTLLRAFTPSALRAFWNAREVENLAETARELGRIGALTSEEGPVLAGSMLSCASGYADLPPGSQFNQEGIFRALFDCRLVLRTLRSVAKIAGEPTKDGLSEIALSYSTELQDLKAIPLFERANELEEWAETREREVYAQIDSMVGPNADTLPVNHRFEGVYWLDHVTFTVGGKTVAPKRLLMIDDFHKLRRHQRRLLLKEVTEMRPSVPVWIAARTTELGDELLVPGARSGRDATEYVLEQFWADQKGKKFRRFARNVVDRRMAMQAMVASPSLEQSLRPELRFAEIASLHEKAVGNFERAVESKYSHSRYNEWVTTARRAEKEVNAENIRHLYAIRILMARDAARKQMALDFELSEADLEDRESSQVRGAGEMFASQEVGMPYYYGFDRLCQMATSNIEELLSLAAALYDGLRSKQSLRTAEIVLSPAEQQAILRKSAKEKRDFIPRQQSDGLRGQRLIDGIGSYCYDRTFLPNAPYAPGVTGVRLSDAQIEKLMTGRSNNDARVERLKNLMAECVAENLLFESRSAASETRDKGTIFYLNRRLCCYYGLPLALGGWQDVRLDDLLEWAESGRRPKRQIAGNLGKDDLG